MKLTNKKSNENCKNKKGEECFHLVLYNKTKKECAILEKEIKKNCYAYVTMEEVINGGTK